MRSRRWGRLADTAGLAAVVAMVVCAVAVYVRAELFFYYWDHAVHQDIACDTTEAFRSSWAAGWQALARSFHNDYNALFALPLVPFLRLFGCSRVAYEIALAVAYFVPFVLSLGWVALRLAPSPRRAVFWTTVVIALLVPMSWVPILRGFPDTGSAALFLVALSIYLRDTTLRKVGALASVGALMGLAVLFRRHFAYAALAFYCSAALSAAGLAATDRAQRGQALRQTVLSWTRLAASGLLAAAVLAGLGWGFVARLGAWNYHALYSAYRLPPAAVFRWYLIPYGWIAWILAAFGFAGALVYGQVDRAKTAFAVLLGGVSALLWLLHVRQIGEQYTLHFTPLIVLGYAVGLRTLYLVRSTVVRRVSLAALGLLLVANVVLGLSTPDPEQTSSAASLFAGRWGPRVRWDYGEIARLVDSLRQLAKTDEGILVVASSHSINPDLVRHAEWILHGRNDARLRILAVPEVDSRDEYPLGALLEAQHVVLVEPPQYHLGAENQRVVEIAHDLFSTVSEIAHDFAPRPERFRLADGATVSIVSRVRPTSLATALRTLRIVEERLPNRPGTQSDWAVVNRRFPSWLSLNPDGSADWVAHPAVQGQTPSTVLAYVRPTFGATTVSGAVGFIDGRCQGATLAFAAADPDGRLEPLAEVRKRPGEDGHFQVKLRSHARGRLVLSLLDHGEGASIDYCLLRVDRLTTREARR